MGDEREKECREMSGEEQVIGDQVISNRKVKREEGFIVHQKINAPADSKKSP